MTPEPENIEALRKEVLKLMVDRDIRYHDELVDALLTRTGKQYSRQNIGMALTGYRQTRAYHNMLLDLKQILEDWPPDKAA